MKKGENAQGSQTDQNDQKEVSAHKESSQMQFLSQELKKYYSQHNLNGVEDYILKPEKGQSSTSTPRFIRLNPRHDMTETLELLRNELVEQNIKQKPILVPWLDARLAFYSLPGHFSLSSSDSYKTGRIYGMDVSSGAAVAALLLDTYDASPSKSKVKGCMPSESENFRVLDLCCAPGLKTCAIVDLICCLEKEKESRNLSIKSKNVYVAGVDISEPRMSLCKNVIRKYFIHQHTPYNISSLETKEELQSDEKRTHIQLFCNDGTRFGTTPYIAAKDNSERDTESELNLVFDSQIAFQEENHARHRANNNKGVKRKRMNKSARARERRKLQKIVQEGSKSNFSDTYSITGEENDLFLERFDRVLVDAECSTDGALRHLKVKYNDNLLKTENKQRGCDIGNSKLTNENQVLELLQLQRKLIESGFRLLKPGGVMIYSTCSLSHKQNEDIVNDLLRQNKGNSYLIPLDFVEAKNNMFVKTAMIPGTIRFLPNITRKLEEDKNNQFYGGGFFLAKIAKK